MAHLPYPTTRDLPVEKPHTTLLFIDVQNFCARRDGTEFAHLSKEEFDRELGWFFDKFESETLPNMQKLQAGCRQVGIEVMYTVICNLTADGRDRSLDYKITGFNEIVLPKTSSGVFNSTNIDYVLRNLGIRYLIVAGVVTDQCVDMAVRDAADRGYLVSVPGDACATYTQERHDTALKAYGGYCWVTDTDTVVSRINAIARAAA